MKGQKRNAIIAATLALLFIAGYFALSYFPKSDTEDGGNTRENLYVLEYKLKDVDSITVFNSGNKLYTMKVETVSDENFKFSILGKESFSYNEDALSSVANSVVYPLATLKVEDNAQDLAKYGLADTGTYFLITLKDGSSDKLLIGSLTSAQDGYYVKAQNTNTVYVMTRYYVENLLRDEGYYRSAEIFESVEGLPESATGAYIEKEGKAAVKVELSDSVMGGKYKIAYKYALTLPYTMPIDPEKFTGNLLNSITQIAAAGVVADNPTDLSKYGLDKPYRKISIETATAKKTLLVGGLAGDNRYCMVEGTNSVLLVSDSSLGVLDISYKDIASYLVLIRDITTVDTLTFKAKADTYTMKISPSTEEGKLNITLNGKAVDESAGRGAYMNIISILAADALQSKPQGEAEYSILFKYKDATFEKIEFVKLNERQYAMFIDKKAQFYCNVTDIQTAVDSLKSLAEK